PRQSCSSDSVPIPYAQTFFPRAPSTQSSPTLSSYRRHSKGATQVDVCTTFVNDVIGTCSTERSFHILCHSSRETSPCFWLTPLVERHIRKAKGVRPNNSFESPVTRPSFKNSSCDKPRAVWGQSPN